MKEILLARSFVGATRGRTASWGFWMASLSSTMGTALLTFTFGMYDSYLYKLESITLSLYPHVMLLPEGVAEAHDTGAAKSKMHQLCELVCRGELLLSSSNNATTSQSMLASSREEQTLWNAFRRIEGVRAIAPLVLEERSFDIAADGRKFRETLRVLGVRPAANIPRVDLFVSHNALAALQSATKPSLVVSASLWERWFHDEPPPISTAPRSLALTKDDGSEVQAQVIGAFHLGLYQISKNMVVTNLSTAQALLGLGENVSYFGVSLDEPYASGAVAEASRERLRQEGYVVADWTSLAARDFESLRLFRNIIFVVLGSAFLIVGFNIRNVLTTILIERRSQFGILRALGVRGATLRLVFLIVALMMGLVGLTLGAGLGAGLVAVFDYWLNESLEEVLPISNVRFGVEASAIGEIALLILLTCSVSAWIAGTRAVKLHPVDCLRAE